MTEPKRLVESSGDPLARALLGTARARAPQRAKERGIAAAAAAVATTGLTSGGTAAAAGGVVAKVGPALGIKVLAVVGLIGAAAVAAGAMDGPPARGVAVPAAPAASGPPSAALAAPSSASASPPPAVSRVVPAPNEHAEPTGETGKNDKPLALRTASSVATFVASAQAPRHTTDAPAASGSTVRDELAWLERVRAATSAREPAQALALLDEYGARFPRAAMMPEATVLRIEALLAAGDRPAAERAADRFLAQSVSTPYASRVRSLLGRSNE